MIDKIFAFGDSFIYGTGVAPEHSWISQLGQHLNIETVNAGISGGSNKLSIVKLFDYWTQINENSLVVFAWTSPVRTAFYHSPSDNWENVQLGHYYEDVSIRTRVEHYYAHHYNDIEGYTEFYQQQIMLAGLLDNHNIKYCFINSFLDNPKGINMPDEKRAFMKS